MGSAREIINGPVQAVPIIISVSKSLVIPAFPPFYSLAKCSHNFLCPDRKYEMLKIGTTQISS